MNALEGLPLVMEPNSSFYTSPVLVLDFQSLYPSIMIAYNYCYSTCIGKLKGMGGSKKLGILDNYEISLDQLYSLRDHVNSMKFQLLNLSFSQWGRICKITYKKRCVGKNATRNS